VLDALGRSARATVRDAWLAPVGLVVLLARVALALPAQLFAAAILPLAAAGWLARSAALLPLDAAAAGLDGVAAAGTSARFLALLAGLWLAGRLLAAALRVAYLAGALPSLGAALAGLPSGPRFAAGFARGLAPLLPAAALAAALRFAAWAALAGALLGAVVVLGAGPPGPPALAAVLGAAALSGATLAVLASGALADALLARVALRGEGPLTALARAARRLARRPAAFLAIPLVALAAQAILAGSAHALATVAGATSAHPLVLLGPQLMGATLAALAVAAVELWRLGASALLACHAADDE
jgi:hypothetical protein